MAEPEVTEEYRFSIKQGEPVGTQVFRLVGQIAQLLERPGAEGARLREIVVVIERPVK